MTHPDKLGNSQVLTYDGYVDEEIGVRVRERLAAQQPKLTQRELAEKIDITPDALSRALSGKRAFTAVELVTAAEVLGTSAHWFVTGEPDPFAVKVAGRHTFDHDTKSHVAMDWSEVDEILKDIALAYIQVYPAPVASLSRRAAPGVEDVRAALVDAEGAGWVRTFAGAVEKAFGVDVIRVGGFGKGLALEVVGHRAIIVGETSNWFFENWSIAHELGHILRDDLSEIASAACDDPQSERRANAFAAELLLPEERIRSINWESIDGSSLARFIWESGVSTDALSRRLTALKIPVSDSVLEWLQLKTQALLRKFGGLAAGGVDEVRERMRDASSRRFPEHLVDAHLEAVAEGKLRPSFLAWMLGVPEHDLEEQLAPSQETSVDIDALARDLGLLPPLS